MRGEPIESVKSGLQCMTAALRHDPHALECVHLSLVTFDRDVKILTPLTPLEDFQVPDFTTSGSGPTHLGLALEKICQQVDSEVIKSTADQKGDWKPLLFVMTDGSPSDKQKFKEVIPLLREKRFGVIVGCAAGPKARVEDLKQFADEVVSLETMDSATFQHFFKWVSASISSGNASHGISKQIELPAPPPDVVPSVM
jgi:uncharacterized protein YegL